VFANKIKRIQTSIDALGHHFQHPFISAQRLSEHSTFITWRTTCIAGVHLSLFILSNKCIFTLTPWSRVLLEKLTGSQLVKKFPAFYVTLRFITAITRHPRLSLSCARSIQPIPPHPNSWRSILISCSHLRQGLFQVAFYGSHQNHLSSPPNMPRATHLIIVDFITQIIFGE
jgi:hypothetical protein